MIRKAKQYNKLWVELSWKASLIFISSYADRETEKWIRKTRIKRKKSGMLIKYQKQTWLMDIRIKVTHSN